MLLREVEYARPATVEEAIALLSEHEGARALAGGQTLVNVMKARAASPDVLVDLADLDELRTRISVPTRKPGTGDGMAGVTLGAHGTYIVSAAATVGPSGTTIALGCVSSVPARATAMEGSLTAGDYSEAAVRAAAHGLGATIDPPSDVHADADYRRHLAEVSAVRAVLQAAERAKG